MKIDQKILDSVVRASLTPCKPSEKGVLLGAKQRRQSECQLWSCSQSHVSQLNTVQLLQLMFAHSVWQKSTFSKMHTTGWQSSTRHGHGVLVL